MALRQTRGYTWLMQQIPATARAQADQALRWQSDALREIPEDGQRARSVHARLDELQASFLAGRPELAAQVRCARGCGHCCHMWVGVTREEGQLLAERVAQGAVSVDRNRLARQAEAADPAAFFALPREVARCVFLDDGGACAVHPHRPSVCRLILVASDPELCRTADTATQIQAVICPDAELLASAALSAEGDPGPAAGRSLAQVLQDCLDPRPRASQAPGGEVPSGGQP